VSSVPPLFAVRAMTSLNCHAAFELCENADIEEKVKRATTVSTNDFFIFFSY
jgi:hypothetical protein